jgi:hypothetical protein
MMGARILVETFAGVLDPLGAVVHLGLYGARDDVGIDDGRGWNSVPMVLRYRCRADSLVNIHNLKQSSADQTSITCKSYAAGFVHFGISLFI